MVAESLPAFLFAYSTTGLGKLWAKSPKFHLVCGERSKK